MISAQEPKESWESDISECGELHSEDCCVHFPEDSRACDVGTGVVDCCENMQFLAKVIRQAISTAIAQREKELREAVEEELERSDDYRESLEYVLALLNKQ